MNATLATRPRFGQVPQAVGDEFNRFVDEVFGTSRSHAGWAAPAALWEENDKLHVEIELPGVHAEDLELTFENGVLRIAAERKGPEGERAYWHNERRFGRVERSVKLPEAIDGESIQAELAAGVLHVTLSKRPEALPKKIEVKVG